MNDAFKAETRPAAAEFDGLSDPWPLFERWMREAEASEINDPDAMTLATVDEAGLPNARIVLLKGFDERGFVFYTNYESVKGRELVAQRKAALVLHWKSLRRQVRARGPVEPVSDDEADAYFVTRPEGSRIGAWASKQSRPLASRATLEEEVAAYAEKFAGSIIPRPPYWSGFRLIPSEFEFWRDGAFRLHDRIRLSRETPEAAWRAERLYP
jgi:pyridoxamine 5'-phosphate oxidase